MSEHDFDPPETCDCPGVAPGFPEHLVTDHKDDCGYDWFDEDACTTCWGCHASRATGAIA